MMDNAKYHSAGVTREYLAHHGIRTMYTAPYSYQASPVELYFSGLKSVNLNTRKESTGKK